MERIATTTVPLVTPDAGGGTCILDCASSLNAGMNNPLAALRVFDCTRGESIGDGGGPNITCHYGYSAPRGCGRRPEGLEEIDLATPFPSAIGAYLARAAHLEAASVFAFERLGQELSALGVSRRLVERCNTAASDERRHEQLMTRLARLAHTDVPVVRIEERPARDSLAIALENATEGLVGEALGALIAVHQRDHALDPTVRRVMGVVAEDELDHAALSFDVARALNEVLDDRARAEVTRARAHAHAALRVRAIAEATLMPAILRASLGLPGLGAISAMIDGLHPDALPV